MSSGPKTTTTEIDPWKNMPDWLKGSLKGRTAEGDALWDEWSDSEAPPILGLSPEEKAAYDDFEGRSDLARDRSDAAYDGLEGMEAGGLDYFNKMKGKYGFNGQLKDMGDFDHGYQPGEFESGYKQGGTKYDGGYKPGEFDGGFDQSEGAYSGDRMTELLGNKDFGMDYTDNVVDTTLAGMERQAKRDSLMRQSQQAADGGISNTRSAVADAVAGGETQRAMAETEAGLRDSAQRFETDNLFKQADALDSSDRFKSQDQRSAEQYATETRLKEQGMSDDAARFLSQQNLTEQQLKEGNKRFGAEMALKEAGMSDQAAQALANMNLSEQELVQKAKEFGINFDKSMLDAGVDALENDRDFDLKRRGMMDSLSNSALKQDMAIFDIFNTGGKEARMLEQAELNSDRDHAGWLANFLSGTNLGGTMSTGSTQTNTTPGNGALQNILGIGTSLAGAYMQSDERVKEDIDDPDESALDKLAKLEDGIKEYKYKDGYGHTSKRTSGLMAQDLEKANIEGAVVEIDGVKHVDPYPVLATVVEAVRELDQERRAG